MKRGEEKGSDREGRRVAVSIVVSWNVRGYLEKLLADLQRQTGPFHHKIVVVDNASEDGSAEMVRDRFPGVCLLRNDSNRGFTAAVNRAIRAFPEAHYYFIVNPDIRCGEETLSRLVRETGGHPLTGIAGCRIKTPTGRDITLTTYPRMIRGLLVEAKVFWWQWTEPRRRRTKSNRRDVECVEGSCMLIRADVILDIGFFDERFWAYFEETDFCLRARRAGWKVTLVPDLVVTHYCGRSFRQRPFERRLIWNRSFRRFLEKHHPLRARVYPLLIRILWALEYVVRSVAALFFGRAKFRVVDMEFKALFRDSPVHDAP